MVSSVYLPAYLNEIVSHANVAAEALRCYRLFSKFFFFFRNTTLQKEVFILNNTFPTLANLSV